jgi:hypothetical protein
MLTAIRKLRIKLIWYKKERVMTNERLTIKEIEHKYPYAINGICSVRSPCLALLTLSENFDEWLLIVDYELSENTELLSGRLIAHSKSRKEIRDISMNYTGRVAVHSTRKTPEGVGYLL